MNRKQLFSFIIANVLLVAVVVPFSPAMAEGETGSGLSEEQKKTVVAESVYDYVPSPDLSDIITPSKTYANQVYTNVSVAAGAGKLEKITDASFQSTVMDRINALDDQAKNSGFLIGVSDRISTTITGKILYNFAFDVKGIQSGEVTVRLGDDGEFKADENVGNLAIVSHYNTTSRTWEQMYAKVGTGGLVTFSFDSYSPVVISILNVKSDDVVNELVRIAEGNSGSSSSDTNPISQPTENPSQNPYDSSDNVAPKMGEPLTH